MIKFKSVIKSLVVIFLAVFVCICVTLGLENKTFNHQITNFDLEANSINIETPSCKLPNLKLIDHKSSFEGSIKNDQINQNFY